MAHFENYRREADAIELEIARKGIVLGIDWADEVQVRQLARDALTRGRQETMMAAGNPDDSELQARAELFGLAALMLKTMQQSAEEGFETHGGAVWKTFGRALWREAQDLPREG